MQESVPRVCLAPKHAFKPWTYGDSHLNLWHSLALGLSFLTFIKLLRPKSSLKAAAQPVPPCRLGSVRIPRPPYVHHPLARRRTSRPSWS